MPIYRAMEYINLLLVSMCITLCVSELFKKEPLTWTSIANTSPPLAMPDGWMETVDENSGLKLWKDTSVTGETFLPPQNQIQFQELLNSVK